MKLFDKNNDDIAAAVINVIEGKVSEAITASEYTVGAEKSKFKKGYRGKVTHSDKGYTMYLAAVSFKDEKDAKAHAQAYLDGYAKRGDRAAQRFASDFVKANQSKVAEERLTEMTQRFAFDNLKKATAAEKSAPKYNLRVDSSVEGKIHYVAVTGKDTDITKWMKTLDEDVVVESLDEARQMKDPKKDSMVTKGGKTIVIDKDKEKEYLKKGWVLAEADEQMDPKDHVKEIDDGDSFVVVNAAGKAVAKFKDRKEAEDYAKENHDELMDDDDKEQQDEVAEPEAQGEKDFKAKHVIKKQGENDDGSEIKEAAAMCESCGKVHEGKCANEESDKQKKYQAFFQKALKKFGVKSPSELEKDKRAEFFDYVDANYEAENEED